MTEPFTCTSSIPTIRWSTPTAISFPICSWTNPPCLPTFVSTRAIPETIFRIESEIYRNFHMRDPETFYNKSDAWDIAKFTSGQNTQARARSTELSHRVPCRGSHQPEFMLMLPFTPRNRDNLIGLMMARCDGEHLGEKSCCCCPSSNSFLDRCKWTRASIRIEYLERSDFLEPTRVAGAARPDAGAANRQYVPVCRAHLPAGIGGEDAAVEKGGAGVWVTR